jgi:hypothetical protein
VICALADILWLNKNGAVPPRGVNCAVDFVSSASR